VLPALGDIERYPGLYVASGFSGHGFGLGPGVGKVMANHILGNEPQFDLAPFRFERFAKRPSFKTAFGGWSARS
jgi:glycine/D-amino acid oxidase-like deaminating enzyme